MELGSDQHLTAESTAATGKAVVEDQRSQQHLQPRTNIGWGRWGVGGRGWRKTIRLNSEDTSTGIEF